MLKFLKLLMVSALTLESTERGFRLHASGPLGIAGLIVFVLLLFYFLR